MFIFHFTKIKLPTALILMLIYFDAIAKDS